MTLDLSWNAQTQPTLNGDGDPPTGDRWVIVVASVSNPSNSEVELGTFQLTTETESTVRDDEVNGVTLIGDSDVANRQLEDVILKANGETTGLLIYGVRADVTAATFGVEDASSFAFEPTCDEELRIDVPL